ncbi:hypothetical protein M9H77_26693 [Catharanthus roseus]|uniref:Uncharacterized protein n=1 Tax=Catharanthus roseus TaxID=4058 RepID=A0ACC0ABY1_CATRO|nr:hypothetical protein M9H77_26693 [Catharanthus roseus]
MSVSLKIKSEKEEQREEIVVFGKSEELNFYANETNSFFASELLCMQNFGDSSKDEDGKLAYNGSMFDHSCHDFGVMNNVSIESTVVGFGLDAKIIEEYKVIFFKEEPSGLHQLREIEHQSDLVIDHTLSLEGEIILEFVEFIYFKNQEANEVKHKKFGMTRLVFDP